MNSNDVYVPFSQRTGLAPVPLQLKLGEVSTDLRRLIDYSLSKEIDREHQDGYNSSYFSGKWKEVAMDLHVKFSKKSASSFKNESAAFRRSLEGFVEKAPIGKLFDLVEFFIRHKGCSVTLKSEISDAFVSAGAAYRISDSQIIAIGTHEQADAFVLAVSASESAGASASRRHLIAAGTALRRGNWADSIRESIHSVEAMARRIDTDAKTLGPALKSLEKNGYLHGSLKLAFEKLYGYTNDEDGIRHALLEDEARVDETDALFMLGACASFVSYLIARDASRSAPDTD